MENITVIAISTLLIGYELKQREERKNRRNRRMWVKPWIMERERKGAYNALLNEFILTDREDYRRFMRMNSETFHELLEKVRPHIQGQVIRLPISAEEKLAVTLRFLATGEDYQSLSYLFRIHRWDNEGICHVACCGYIGDTGETASIRCALKLISWKSSLSL